MAPPIVTSNAPSAIAAGTPNRASAAPAAAGPRSVAAFSPRAATTFAAVSSPGVRASHGSTLAWIGRYAPASQEPMAPAPMTTNGGAPTNAPSAATPRRSARTASVMRRIRSGANLSVALTTAGVIRMAGRVRTTPYRATSPAPPSLYA